MPQHAFSASGDRQQKKKLGHFSRLHAILHYSRKAIGFLGTGKCPKLFLNRHARQHADPAPVKAHAHTEPRRCRVRFPSPRIPAADQGPGLPDMPRRSGCCHVDARALARGPRLPRSRLWPPLTGVPSCAKPAPQRSRNGITSPTPLKLTSSQVAPADTSNTAPCDPRPLNSVTKMPAFSTKQ